MAKSSFQFKRSLFYRMADNERLPAALPVSTATPSMDRMQPISDLHTYYQLHQSAPVALPTAPAA